MTNALETDDPAKVAPEPTTQASRLTLALRQVATLGGCLILGGMVVERLRPDEATGAAGYVSTPFVWAAIVWAGLLLLDALAFEQSLIRRLERTPLLVGAAVGIVVLVVGLARFTAGNTADRLPYLFGNAVGAAIFWWGIAGLAVLLWHAAIAGRTSASDAG